MKKTKIFLFTLMAFFVVGFAINVNAREVTEDLTLTEDVNEEIVIPAGKTVTLNLGGKTITAPSGKVAITNNGVLTIEGNGSVVANGNYAVLNHGSKLTINGGSYSKTDTAATQSLISNGWYTNSDNTSGDFSEMIINDGSFDGGDYTAIKNDSFGMMTINGGTFDTTPKVSGSVTTYNVVGLQEAGKSLVINGGTFNAALEIQNYASVEGEEKIDTINAGTFNGAVNFKAANATDAVKSGTVKVSIAAKPVFNSSLSITNSGAPSGTIPFVLEQFDVKTIGGGLSLSGRSTDYKMPGVNLEGMNIGGKLTLSYVEASTIKNSTVNSDISAGDITLDNVKAKSLVSNNKDVVQNVKNSDIVWLKQGANHPVTLNANDSTVGKIAPSNNGNTIQYIDTISLDGVTIASDEENDLATGELILNGGDVSIKDSSVEKISIPKKPKEDVNVTVEEGSVVDTIVNNKIEESAKEVNINLPESYELQEDGTILMSLSGEQFKVSDFVDKVYNGNKRTQLVKVYNGDIRLVFGTDFKITNKDNVNAGTATVVITGKGKYTGKIEKTYTIKPAKIINAVAEGIVKKTYNGKALTQSKLVVKYKDTVLEEGTDYAVSYEKNNAVGRAMVVITGKGNFTGIKKKGFTIVPKKVLINKFTTYGNSINVLYNSVPGRVKYQVAYKQNGNKSFKYDKTSYTKYSAISLKYNVKYYFKVRAYKEVNGITYYGAWSDVKTKTIVK